MAYPNLPARPVEEIDDRVIRMRADGLSYSDMAQALGLTAAQGARQRYFSARARQIPPECLPRTHERPGLGLIAWAAGFLDGEGCIYGYESGAGTHGRFQFGVRVAQTCAEPIEELHRVWGGTVRVGTPRNPRHQQQWWWSIQGRDAAAFLEDVLPHLRVKFRAAQAAIPCLYRVHTSKQRFSEREAAERRSAIAVLRETNSGKAGRRGGDPDRVNS